MGSGKSTVGRMLARSLGWRLIDLDREVRRREGRSIPEIFSHSGEPPPSIPMALLGPSLGRQGV
jgi:shikimate kinase